MLPPFKVGVIKAGEGEGQIHCCIIVYVVYDPTMILGLRVHSKEKCRFIFQWCSQQELELVRAHKSKLYKGRWHKGE